MSIFRKHKPEEPKGGGHSKNPGGNGGGFYVAVCGKCRKSFAATDQGKADTMLVVHEYEHR